MQKERGQRGGKVERGEAGMDDPYMLYLLTI